MPGETEPAESVEAFLERHTQTYGPLDDLSCAGYAELKRRLTERDTAIARAAREAALKPLVELVDWLDREWCDRDDQSQRQHRRGDQAMGNYSEGIASTCKRIANKLRPLLPSPPARKDQP